MDKNQKRGFISCCVWGMPRTEDVVFPRYASILLPEQLHSRVHRHTLWWSRVAVSFSHSSFPAFGEASSPPSGTTPTSLYQASISAMNLRSTRDSISVLSHSSRGRSQTFSNGKTPWKFHHVEGLALCILDANNNNNNLAFVPTFSFFWFSPSLSV